MTKIGKLTVGVVWNPNPSAIGVYIGRSSKQPSPLGNPYIIGAKYSREVAINHYMPYIRNKAKTDPKVKAELVRIAKLIMMGQDVELLCYCKGKEVKPCHGDYLVDFISAAVKRKLNVT